MIRTIVAVSILSVSAWLSAAELQLKKGDHVCLVGNTLAERMQYDGWLETFLHSQFPDHELVIRNLGYSGYELETSKRLRSKDFGAPDEWLAGSSPVPQPAKLAHAD